MADLIVFHDNCHDGITAAWVARQRWPTAELYPGKYDVAPDLGRLRARDIVIADFSWKRGPMLAVREAVKSIQVFDHHASAKDELAGLDWCVFDMNRSGAGITWDELFPDTPRPWIVDYVEDRDLFRFALTDSREVHASLASWPIDIDVRDRLAHSELREHRIQGAAILRYHDQLVGQACKYRTRAVILGHDVPCVALPVISMVSDVGHELSRGEKFAATFTARPDGSNVYSLRSAPDGMDVSKVAVAFGGGGHPHAAGFTLAAGASLNPTD